MCHSLYHQIIERNKKLSIKTICMMGIQLLRIMEELHENKILHLKLDLRKVSKGPSGISMNTPSEFSNCLQHNCEEISKWMNNVPSKCFLRDLHCIFYLLIAMAFGELPNNSQNGINMNNPKEGLHKSHKNKELCDGIDESISHFGNYVLSLSI